MGYFLSADNWRATVRTILQQNSSEFLRSRVALQKSGDLCYLDFMVRKSLAAFSAKGEPTSPDQEVHASEIPTIRVQLPGVHHAQRIRVPEVA